jgi:hypothetical protein
MIDGRRPASVTLSHSGNGTWAYYRLGKVVHRLRQYQWRRGPACEFLFEAFDLVELRVSRFTICRDGFSFLTRRSQVVEH